MPSHLRIGVLANAERPGTLAIVERIRRWTDALRWTVSFVETVPFDRDDGGAQLQTWECQHDIDLLFALGGDGTMLYAVRSMVELGVPVMGINTGTLGFLTAVSPDDLDGCLALIEKGDYQVWELMMLQASRGKKSPALAALNDVVIDKGGIARIIRVSLYAGEEFVTSMRCDGLIIATPTGSTAYSLSVGGPIVEPTVSGIVVSPISPHTLAQRPMIFPAETQLAVVIDETADSVSLTIDGQMVEQLQEGQRVEVSCHPKKARLLRFSDYCFYSVLRNKLRWGETSHPDESSPPRR